MLAVEKGRNALVGARQLAYHIGAHPVAVLEGPGPRGGLQLVLDRVVVDEIRLREGAAIEGPEALEARGVVLLRLAHPLKRSLGELRLRPRVLAPCAPAGSPTR